MITELKIEGFKTLRNVTVPLSPGITVLVGANNSGKSNVFAALKLMRESVKLANFAVAAQALGGLSSIASRNPAALRSSVTVSMRLGQRTANYTVGIAMGGKSGIERLNFDAMAGAIATTWYRDDNTATARGPQKLSGLKITHGSLLNAMEDHIAASRDMRLALAGLQVLDFSVAAIRAEAKFETAAQLGPDGENLSAVLDLLSNTKPDALDAIMHELKSPLTQIKRILTPPGIRPGTKVVGVQEEDGSVYSAHEMSDGLLLFIAISVAVQEGGNFDGLIAIEEPERGIHPRRIRDMVDQFRRAAAKGKQIVLTTHSPILLDEFRDTPESVLIFDRDAGGTHIQRLSDHPDWKDDLTRDKPLGDLWFSGVLGGVPR